MAQIEVVGIGLDGVAGLTKPAVEIINNATVLAGSYRHLSYVESFPAKKLFIDDFQAAIASILQLLEVGEQIVVLVSGDPLFFGLGRLLLEKIPAEKINFHPHLSSIQLAFNRLKITWHDAVFISVHGRNTKKLIKFLKQGKEKIAILTDSSNNPSAIARLFLSLNLPVSYSFHICENLGGSSENITFFAANKVSKLAELQQDFASLNVVILLREIKVCEVNLDRLPMLGLSDRVFLSFSDRPSLITKKEIRTAILGELALQPQQIVWDIGAGTGSVSIEIARLCPDSQIFAVEKTSMGVTLIIKNCQRFKVNNVNPVSGKAPESLLKLPDPNRIFIGGSGGNLLDILELCSKKIKHDGVLVIALATLEHCHQAVNWLNNNKWHYRLLQLQISRSTPIKNLTRFTPLNPVTIITSSLSDLTASQ
ncbi:bifunctional cobalt-precorrin-7 (C(5))-methyltransferase/cobalt-precorrin-6B (C(15))-methyltransferase [Myxosarcina sp. GI1]|uniref:bifunctional cobalt-precorrin-7 (C(5))-methyltransferase/cobalt-precorrin-6B (C(15))-methyltransferase n=1 Tax=Myxosarcina sp. GI1 TaxID=1541065 RepID=UPI00055B90EE|nr:bifunctional cobalt-precorrin-7 (C(5))-methyltransferase/cobalt-precorrin-6B (C(15))-methyltransferase [Myxosarcina sp. GI1]